MRLSLLTLFALLLCSGASAVFGQSLPGYQAPAKSPGKEQSLQTKAASGQAPLARIHNELKPDARRIKRLPALSRRDKQTRSDKLLHVGVVRPLASALNPFNDSATYTVAEGDVRVSALASQGARSLRVHFTDFSLPPGARVFVYSLSNPDAFWGPFEGRGPWNDGAFWTPALPGDQVAIEYLSPNGSGAGEKPFLVPELAHIYKNEFATDAAGSCNLEVTPPWTEVAKSVGMLEFVTGGLVAACTGTLLNDSNTAIDHYVLTANHCISTQSEAQSAQMFWNYNSGDDPPGGTPSSFGPGLMVTGTASDFTLLRFGGVVPGLFYSGWDASPIGASTSVTGIHHPQASHKRIAFGASNSNCAAGLPGPCANFTGVEWSQGITEPGSSGSGLWTGTPDNAKLVGTLTGGESSCANPTGSDYYGRFSVTYPNISAFLSGNSCVTSLTASSQGFTAAGGTGTLNVTAPGGCNWSVSSTADFLTITSAANGTGNGSVSFAVAANSEIQRSGSLVAGTKVLTINQAGGGVCAPAPINMGQTVNGALATSDCQLTDGSYADGYSFNGVAGQRISIALTAAFDTYLYLLNPDGSTLAINDDVSAGDTNSRIPTTGFLTLPTTGSYTILATSLNPGTTGSYSLTLSEKAKQTLTVTSTPITGVNVTVTPAADTNGQGNGATQFTRTYYQGDTVTLNTQTLIGGNEFKRWQKDGVDAPSTSPVYTFNMDTDHTLTAVFGPVTTYTLTVNSSNPGSGVSISVSPNDNSSQGNGATQFTRTYNQNTFVDLFAPATAPNGNIFQKWQKDGVDVNSGDFVEVLMNGNHTVTAVYVVPNTFTLTVASQNPNSGVNITVSPNDSGGSGDGATQFTRNYNQNTQVTLTAPAAASNGNIFDRWLKNGQLTGLSRSIDVFMVANTTMTAVYLTKPVIFAEEGTNNVAALDSVTFKRGPFRILNPLNFSADQHTRIIFFTSDLGLTQADLSNPATLVVDVPTANLPVENVGPLTGIPGLVGSYVIVRLPDNIPNGSLDLRIRLRGVTSDARKLNIVP